MDLERLTKELMRDEGVRLKPYRCSAGKLTIGVGRNLDDNGISMREAEMLLDGDIADVVDGLDAKLPWWTGLDDVRQRVLANMAFNMGIHGLLEFKTTLALVKDGRYTEAAGAMLASRWAQQVGSRAIRLSKMMATGRNYEDINPQ